MNKVVYANLGANFGKRMMYIRSTDIESKNWESLLMSFPDEALFHMTKGRKVVIIDRCCKKIGKVQRIFVPVFLDFLRRIKCQDIRNKALKFHIDKALQAYRSSKAIHRKYEFFKSRINVPCVVGRTIQMKKEPTILV